MIKFRRRIHPVWGELKKLGSHKRLGFSVIGKHQYLSKDDKFSIIQTLVNGCPKANQSAEMTWELYDKGKEEIYKFNLLKEAKEKANLLFNL